MKNKRLKTLIISSSIWLVGVLIFKQDAVHFAEAIALVVAPYLAAETYRPSEKK